MLSFPDSKQDGPSLESSSYLSLSLRYLGPWDPWTLEPLDLGTLGPLLSSNTSSYFPLHPLTSSYLFLLLSSFGIVWLWRGGWGWVLWHWRIRLEMVLWLYIYLKKLWDGWAEPWDLLLPSTFSTSKLLPPPYSFQTSSYLLLKGLRWLISS